MGCKPPHPDSLEGLRELRAQVADRGDECLALLLGGVEAYLAVGREWELLDTMRRFSHDIQDVVENTPSAADLRKLYEQE